MEGGDKGKFVFVGPRLSLTGQNADEWIPARPGAEAEIALALAGELVRRGGDAGPYTDMVSGYTLEQAAQSAGVEVEALSALADQFAEGAALALGPGLAGHHGGATAANLAVLVLNVAAGSLGQTIHIDAAPESEAPSDASLEGAIAGMGAGTFGVAVVSGTNPAYTLPPASSFQDAFSAGSVQGRVRDDHGRDRGPRRPRAARRPPAGVVGRQHARAGHLCHPPAGNAPASHVRLGGQWPTCSSMWAGAWGTTPAPPASTNTCAPPSTAGWPKKVRLRASPATRMRCGDRRFAPARCPTPTGPPRSPRCRRPKPRCASPRPASKETATCRCWCTPRPASATGATPTGRGCWSCQIQCRR